MASAPAKGAHCFSGAFCDGLEGFAGSFGESSECSLHFCCALFLFGGCECGPTRESGRGHLVGTGFLVVDSEDGGELIAGHVFVGGCAADESDRGEESILFFAGAEGNGKPMLRIGCGYATVLFIGGALTVALSEGFDFATGILFEVVGVFDVLEGVGVGSLGFSRLIGFFAVALRVFSARLMMAIVAGSLVVEEL